MEVLVLGKYVCSENAYIMVLDVLIFAMHWKAVEFKGLKCDWSISVVMLFVFAGKKDSCKEEGCQP